VAQTAADIIVVGAGLAGVAAAIEAGKTGAEVLLLEKLPETGGSSILSGGSMAFAGTDLQEKAGIKDSADMLFKDMREVGQFENDEKLVRMYADNQLATYYWLREHGVTFGPIQVSSGQSVPRVHSAFPPDMMRLLFERMAKIDNVRLVKSAAVQRLVQREIQGRVTGVRVNIAGTVSEIEARKAVVLTSGGFSRSADLVTKFCPLQSRALLVGREGNTGDGLKMAWHLGAGFCDMGQIKGTFGNHPKAGSEEHTALMAVYKGAIAVNQNGERFVNESISYKLLGDAVLMQPGAVGYQIFDQNIMDQGTKGVRMFDYERRLEQGLLFKGDTLEELCAKINVPVDRLAATLKEYNGYAEKGRDERFGRTGLSMSFGSLVKLERGPWYAYPSTSAVVATYCGLTVDTGMRVLDVFGEPMQGLYAAGEILGGFHGVAFMTGTGLGKSAICGRVAGINAAR
jgi:flavocytochrome c